MTPNAKMFLAILLFGVAVALAFVAFFGMKWGRK
jgi:hypothetical protein